MDDHLTIFRVRSLFQFSDIHRIQKKTFLVRFMTNKNLFNLPKRKQTVNKNTTLVWETFFNKVEKNKL